MASFNYTNGAFPYASLCLWPDGNFYGTTQAGTNYGSGTYSHGTVFQLTPAGTVSTMATFNFTNGADPGDNALTLGPDGNLYGTTPLGGMITSADPQGMGDIYRLLVAPTMTIQPQAQTNHAGASATFICSTILQPVCFQWQLNGTNLTDGGHISGATNSILTITGIADSDAGTYSVIGSNSQASVSNSSATLTVDDALCFGACPPSPRLFKLAHL